MENPKPENAAATPDPTIHIVEFSAENIKRLRAVRIRPDGNAVIIGGRNDQGKSSIIDAIMYGLMGGRSVCEKPVREGMKRGKVEIDLGNIVVTRTFRASGTSELRVEGKDGKIFKSPQAVLDELIGTLTFDPLAFLGMDAKAQAEMLKRLVGLDFGGLDAERKALFDDRTATTRLQKERAAYAANLPFYPEVTAEPPSVSTLQDELDVVLNDEKEHRNLQNEFNNLTNDLARSNNRIAEIEEALEEAKKEQENCVASYNAFVLNHKDVRADFDPAPITKLRNQISESGEKLRKFQSNKVRAKAVSDATMLERRTDEMTKRIEAIDLEKTRMIETANFPVPGLAFNGESVAYNGNPLDQASYSVRLRVSAAIGMALNPKLRILLIREGAMLDEDSMAELLAMAKERDTQVWLERVGRGKEVSVVIEDGEVEGAATPLDAFSAEEILGDPAREPVTLAEEPIRVTSGGNIAPPRRVIAAPAAAVPAQGQQLCMGCRRYVAPEKPGDKVLGKCMKCGAVELCRQCRYTHCKDKK